MKVIKALNQLRQGGSLSLEHLTNVLLLLVGDFPPKDSFPTRHAAHSPQRHELGISGQVRLES